MDKGHWSDLVEYSWRFLILIAGRYPSGDVMRVIDLCALQNLLVEWRDANGQSIIKCTDKEQCACCPSESDCPLLANCVWLRTEIAPKPPEALFPLCRVAKMCGKSTRREDRRLANLCEYGAFLGRDGE